MADLQDYAKTTQPSSQETDLKALCVELLQGKNVPKNIEASCNIEDSAKKVFVDRNILKRALGNLVSNAVQAMPNGGKLTLRALSESR